MVSENGDDAKLLREFEKSLAEIFRVSGVSIVEGKFETTSVQASKAEGVRCVRCWRIVKEVNADGICPRCEDAVK